MKNKNIIYIIIALIILAFLLNKFIKNSQQSNKAITQIQKQNTFLTKTNSEGSVTVKVTPKAISAGSQAIFEIVFDTHSVELDYDLVNIIRLVDDEGEVYKPVSWNGGKGGHHIEGLLTFPDISKSARKLTLIIQNIDNKDRVFSWDLK